MQNNRAITLFFISIASFLVFTIDIPASQVDDIMAKGNKFYRDGSYEKAIDEYGQLVNEGYFGTSLFYNLGNSYYRVGKIGYAILYYEKALKLSPSDEDVQHNLNFARLSTVDRIQPLPKFFLFDWWESLLNSFSENGWAYIVFVVYLLLIILVALYFFARSVVQQKIIFFSSIAVVFILAICVSLLIVKVNREETLKSGIIVKQAVTVKSSPEATGTDAFVIHEGLKVNIEDKLDAWVKIRLADGKVGWIENNLVKQI